LPYVGLDHAGSVGRRNREFQATENRARPTQSRESERLTESPEFDLQRHRDLRLRRRQVSIGSLVNYFSQPEIGGLTEKVAAGFVALYWGGAMVSRFFRISTLSGAKATHGLSLGLAVFWPSSFDGVLTWADKNLLLFIFSIVALLWAIVSILVTARPLSRWSQWLRRCSQS
jgi:hypothetical protein